MCGCGILQGQVFLSTKGSLQRAGFVLWDLCLAGIVVNGDHYPSMYKCLWCVWYHWHCYFYFAFLVKWMCFFSWIFAHGDRWIADVMSTIPRHWCFIFSKWVSPHPPPQPTIHLQQVPIAIPWTGKMKNGCMDCEFQLSKTQGIFRFCWMLDINLDLFFCQGPSKNRGMALVGTSPCCSSWRVSFGSLSWWSMAWKWHFASEKTVNILTKENHEGEGKGGKIVRALGIWSVGC